MTVRRTVEPPAVADAFTLRRRVPRARRAAAESLTVTVRVAPPGTTKVAAPILFVLLPSLARRTSLPAQVAPGRHAILTFAARRSTLTTRPIDPSAASAWIPPPSGGTGPLGVGGGAGRSAAGGSAPPVVVKVEKAPVAEPAAFEEDARKQ